MTCQKCQHPSGLYYGIMCWHQELAIKSNLSASSEVVLPALFDKRACFIKLDIFWFLFVWVHPAPVSSPNLENACAALFAIVCPAHLCISMSLLHPLVLQIFATFFFHIRKTFPPSIYLLYCPKIVITFAWFFAEGHAGEETDELLLIIKLDPSLFLQ